jgi:hypothetical protein
VVDWLDRATSAVRTARNAPLSLTTSGAIGAWACRLIDPAGGDQRRAARSETNAAIARCVWARAARDDIDLPELYALLIGTSRAAAYAHLDEKVRDRTLAIVFDGLAPRATKPHDGAAAGSHREPPPT